MFWKDGEEARCEEEEEREWRGDAGDLWGEVCGGDRGHVRVLALVLSKKASQRWGNDTI